MPRRSGWRTAGTGAGPGRTRSRPCSPRSTCEAATGSSSTSGASLDGVPVLSPRETLEPAWGRRNGWTVRADALEAIGLPTLAEDLERLPRSAFLDVELKDDPGRGAVDALAAGRGALLRNAVVSSFRPGTLERVAGLAPAWPRWLNTRDLEPATVATAAALGCRGISVLWSAIDEPGLRRARAADLDLAAWTVRRRPTYRRLARLGGGGDLRRGRRARRLTPSGSPSALGATSRLAGDPAVSSPREVDQAWRIARISSSSGRHDRRVGVGLRRVGRDRTGRRPRARPRGPRRVVARGRHRARPGRHAGDRRPRTVVDRLLSRPGGAHTAPIPAFASSAT